MKSPKWCTDTDDIIFLPPIIVCDYLYSHGKQIPLYTNFHALFPYKFYQVYCYEEIKSWSYMVSLGLDILTVTSGSSLYPLYPYNRVPLRFLRNLQPEVFVRSRGSNKRDTSRSSVRKARRRRDPDVLIFETLLCLASQDRMTERRMSGKKSIGGKWMSVPGE